ncbi:MAG: PP2C family protein-serine/threonine phosphatase [Pirellulaceae bacterium]
MLQAPALENELDRLADLYALNLLDQPGEERFDRLTRLARKALGVDMCYLALLDSDKQWFKSKCGVARDSTARDISFCGHAIAGDKTMIVPDALKDQRFNDNPLVTGEPYVRFYAGYPLRGPQGYNIGTFCVADKLPRQWTESERQLFEEYARLAERELSLTDLIIDQNKLLETQAKLEGVQLNMQRELREAADFVHQKLPPRFDNDHMKLDWAFIESSQLGGDMFGLEQLGEDQYLIYLLDVAGHGIGASLLAVSVQNTLRQMLSNMQGAISPALVLSNLNAAFQMDFNQNRFFTMWCGVVDLSQRRIFFANGGHPAAALFDGNHQATRLGQDSMIVGIMPGTRYEDEETEYSPGSRLVLFSDGILEEMNENNDLFGRDRLEEAYRSRCTNGSCKLDAIVDNVRQWNGKQPFADDVSLVELTLK